MAAGASNIVRQPSFIVLAIVAAVGWLIAIWAIVAGTREEAEYQNRIQQLEVSRAAAVTELEELRRTSGMLADLERQVAAARTTLEQIQAEQQQVQQNLTEARQNLTETERRRDEAMRTLSDALASRDRILGELQQAQAQSAELQQQLNGLIEQITARSNDLATMERQLDTGRNPGREAGPPQTGTVDLGAGPNAASPRVPSQPSYGCRVSEGGWVCSTGE
ncbi:hypothetical protein [Microvirga roseola]|uniref:hypothetical protein n=1 Tax=Microvirga roseola TaxID=2883126 RepID=UPI001E537FBC|nr:hypothetical protein [Microvirga roseola]